MKNKKNKNEKALFRIISKIGEIALIEIALDPQTYKDHGYHIRRIDGGIADIDELINIDFKFEYDNYYSRNEYTVDAKVTIKDYHFLDFKLKFMEPKEDNDLTLYDFIYNHRILEDCNYNVVSAAISNSRLECEYKKWMNVEFPIWVIEEINAMHQEQIGRLKNTFKKNRIEQFLHNRDVKYVELPDKRKNVLYLLGKVISDLYQEESGSMEVLTRQDQRKCLELLKNTILPIIGENREDEELESIVDTAFKKVNNSFKSQDKVLSLENKNGDY